MEKANYESYNGFTCYSVPKLPGKETHPSLWFRAEDAETLRAKKDRDEQAARLWKQIAESEFLTMDLMPTPSANDDKNPIHKYYGYMSQAAKYSGFMIWMSEDPAEQKGWIDRTVALLNRAYDGPIYLLDPKQKGGPTDEIYLGTWLQNYASAYDWVQPFLTEAQDKGIREKLIKQADWMGKNIYKWSSRPHNHLSKPAWGLGSAALTLCEEKDAYSWLGVALAAGNDNTRYFFSGDGIYREGSHYMIFSWTNFLPFMIHYNNVSGVNQFQEFQPLMEWGVAVRNSMGWLPNIEDSFIRPFPAHMAASMYKGSSTYLHSSAPLAEIMMWAWNTTDMTPFDEALERTGYNYTGASWDDSLPLDEYLTYDPSIKSTAPDVSPTVFLDGGQSIFRNTWKTSDPAGRYLLFQGVAEADNHQHAEHLSFIISAENQMMASDAGYSRASYSEKIRTEWYNQAAAHNVVTLDGMAPVDIAENVTPVSRHRIDTTFFDFEEKEAPYPSGGKLRRAVAFPGESYFVVADIVSSPHEAEAVALLHGGRATMNGDGNYRVWNYEDDTYGPAAHLHVWTFGSADNFKIENAMGELTYLKGDFDEFPCTKARGTDAEQVFLQILFPSAKGTDPPKVSSVKNGKQVLVTVQDGNVTDRFLLQPANAPAVFQDLESDATFAWVREEDGRVTKLAVREATNLKANGTVFLQSDEPRTGARERGAK
ncbi:heparinase II/III domain-containing protein [Aporhodopirellula aestuarii]|uniref:Heparinase II/III-family protein n=1 Tax=Aporhodopirellula aestuarii TaxID=2950107 RepID=A0ABT0TYK5_9BACT|nr:heparinase II/III family protein [Aporhodopirellula aestuarii]MCM2369610.1 heparinase II/III-family protein [Aporhodopirellula aestuarii]